LDNNPGIIQSDASFFSVPNRLNSRLVSRAQALQNKCRNLYYSIIATTLLARINERLRCQGLK
jgi:hypothetical protein